MADGERDTKKMPLCINAINKTRLWHIINKNIRQWGVDITFSDSCAMLCLENTFTSQDGLKTNLF